MTDATQDPDQRYSVEQAGEYIELATSIEQHGRDRLSYEQLVEVAAEVGVSEEALRAAMEQAERERLRQDLASGSGWRAVADRCLEILCLKPATPPRERPNG